MKFFQTLFANRFALPVVFTFFMLGALSVAASANPIDDLPPLGGKPHFLMDADTGEILSMEKPFQRWAPASVTKMMTAYTVFREVEAGRIAMDSPVRVSRNALAEPPSKMGMPVGTIMTIEAALNIILVKSANDISVALGESAGGSEKKFVEMMNGHAKRLGLHDTRFVNPHGLHHPDQYTSARDMALLAQVITREFRKHDRFFNIPGIRVGSRRLRNHNALVEQFPGTNGMKTGYVCASGFNVVARVKRDGRELIAAVFGGKSGFARNVKTAKLLQEGFDGTLKPTGANIATLKRVHLPRSPRDITKEICPRKRVAIALPSKAPEKRPEDAPSLEEFDAIDTRLPPDALPKSKKSIVDEVLTIKPTRRPVIANAAIVKEAPEKEVSPSKDAAEALSEEKPDKKAKEEKSTLKELAKIYLQPRKRPRKDVVVTLGGAVGLNPFNIKHTDGNVYIPPVLATDRKIEADNELVKPVEASQMNKKEDKEQAKEPS